MKTLLPGLLFLAALATGTAFAGERHEKDVIPTSAGDLAITFLGHGSLLFAFDGMTIAVRIRRMK